MRLKLVAPAVALTLAGLVGGTALAHSSPSAAQIRHEIRVEQKHVDALDQRYDLLRSQADSARATARATGRQVTIQRKVAQHEQRQVAEIAVALYEDRELTSPTALITEPDPQKILNESSVLQELTGQDVAALRQFGVEEALLTHLRVQERRQEQGAAELDRQARGAHREMATLTSKLDALTGQIPHQPGQSGTPHGHYTGPTRTQADRAVAFAYAHLGCPYVWGGTGPCSAGFDCSGLVMQAWAYAGVSIPRTSEEQWADLPKVPVSELRPGDLLIFLDGDHVGMYVGHGELIEAPHTGADVQLAPFSGWYLANFVGAVRP